MATLATLRADVRDLVGDPVAQSNTYTDAQVDAAIQIAIINYCEKTEATYNEKLFPVDGAGFITLDSTVLNPKRVFTTA